jgi:DMSO/TMAO reductase YedYZ molybdopterin-dependent catalytic subunit
MTAGRPSPPHRVATWAGPAAGVAGTAAAIGAGELLAGILPGAPSPVLAVGRAVVDLQPPGAKDLVVALFGTNDKLALEIVVVAVALAIGALVGRLAVGRPSSGTLVIGAFAAVGFLAALRDPEAQPALAAVAAGTEWLAGTWALTRLLPSGGAPVGRTGEPAGIAWDRRGFLLRAGAVGIGSVAATAVGRALLSGTRTPTVTAGLPTPSRTASLPAGADLGLDGVTPVVVPNDRFYRIDTALVVPSVERDAWRLRIHGLVDRETTLAWGDLVQLPIVEQYVTIACVSNEIGGDLVGNTKWTGVPLRTILDIAGVRPEATQLVGRSIDGWTAGAPVAWVMDPAREPLLAIGMDDSPLPREHGYPARLIIPGLYGYVSATKWVTELELTTWEAFDAYWVPLGWAQQAPILTQSRIDRPRHGERVPAGRAIIGGVAWAPDRGVRRVEVAIDGAWADAVLSTPISDAAWVQWRFDWDATPGSHRLEVRATDGAGIVQTADRSAPAPDGARGHHAIAVVVED